jgi:hypothetical protein
MKVKKSCRCRFDRRHRHGSSPSRHDKHCSPAPGFNANGGLVFCGTPTARRTTNDTWRQADHDDRRAARRAGSSHEGRGGNHEHNTHRRLPLSGRAAVAAVRPAQRSNGISLSPARPPGLTGAGILVVLVCFRRAGQRLNTGGGPVGVGPTARVPAIDQTSTHHSEHPPLQQPHGRSRGDPARSSRWWRDYETTSTYPAPAGTGGRIRSFAPETQPGMIGVYT